MIPVRLSVQAAADILRDRQLLLTPLWLIKSINDSNSCVFFSSDLRDWGMVLWAVNVASFIQLHVLFFFFFLLEEENKLLLVVWKAGRQ